MPKTIITAGGFDAIDCKKVRFIHEVSKLGRLHVVLFDDTLIGKTVGVDAKFPLAERMYFVENIRYVSQVHSISTLSELHDVSKKIGGRVDIWVSSSDETIDDFAMLARNQKIKHQLMSDDLLKGYPEHDYDTNTPSRKKVIVTGCYDWFHTGHVRFFEEASEYGDLYVILGHDKNIKELKGPGHPMFREAERKYLAGAIRFVKQALISSGSGWLDAEPEIERLNPDGYVVNEDGDKDIKRKYCEAHDIEYIVLKREPRPGLKRRTSTNLRGF
jgi:cytidyltransferase-like protein